MVTLFQCPTWTLPLRTLEIHHIALGDQFGSALPSRLLYSDREGVFAAVQDHFPACPGDRCVDEIAVQHGAETVRDGQQNSVILTALRLVHRQRICKSNVLEIFVGVPDGASPIRKFYTEAGIPFLGAEDSQNTYVTVR